MLQVIYQFLAGQGGLLAGLRTAFGGDWGGPAKSIHSNSGKTLSVQIFQMHNPGPDWYVWFC